MFNVHDNVPVHKASAMFAKVGMEELKCPDQSNHTEHLWDDLEH